MLAAATYTTLAASLLTLIVCRLIASTSARKLIDLLQASLLLTFQYVSHPLSKFPGPALARVTDGYAGFHAARKGLHLAAFRDHQRYGPVVRQGPNRLVFNTVTALRDIYLNQRVTKSKVYLSSLLSTRVPSMFNALDKKVHSHKRRVLGQLLSERSMRSFEPIMQQQIDVFLRQNFASGRKGEVINMTTRCQRLSADIIGLLAFGYELKTQTGDANIIVPAAMKSTSYRINLYMAWPNISLIHPLIQWLGRRRSQIFYQTLRKMIAWRMNMPKDVAHDLYAVASGDITPNGEKGLQNTELWSEASFFVMAGGMTVSTLLSAVFFMLSRHADAYTRVATEIRTTFSSGAAVVGGPQLSSCKYLRAVIDETMRVAPPTTATPWREEDIYSAVPPSTDGPFVVDGHVIPRGTAVGVSPYSLMHNEAYFPDPFAFRPERWLEDDGSGNGFDKETKATMRQAFAPFALGDRACAGKSMAYLETSLTIAKTLWYFDFCMAPGLEGKLGGGTRGRTDGRYRLDEYQLYDIFTADHDGPNLKLEPRASVASDLGSFCV